MDPFTLQVITLAACSICAYMIGVNVTAKKQEETISDTIIYLCENGFIKHYTNQDNDLEIVELDQEIPEDRG
jgi:hypothetical protein